jgi:hypothetical protein
MIQEIADDIFDSFARSDLTSRGMRRRIRRFDIVQPSKSF